MAWTSSTGGWATTDSLFCLRDDYDLESERFRVSYLQHESRHFADYAIYPELKQIDLEYRAKLTEFAFVEESFMRLIHHFASAASPNEAAPHKPQNTEAPQECRHWLCSPFPTELARDVTLDHSRSPGGIEAPNDEENVSRPVKELE